MSTSNVSVNIQYFSDAYLDKADKVFLRPSPKYSWNEIISGTPVRSQTGGTRKMFAVAQNTFRGFHRINKACTGAKEGFTNYFLSQRLAIINELSSVNTREDLRKLSNDLCDDIRTNLSNCSPTQLQAYNKVRKPIDLYLEHLVAMAIELDEVRARLVPILSLGITDITTGAEIYLRPIRNMGALNNRINSDRQFRCASLPAGYAERSRQLRRRESRR